MLLAASLRPSEVEAGGKAARLLSHWREDPRTTRLRLEPLAGDEFARLVGLHLGIEEPPAELVERLFAASEGNPLFVRELIRAWCDTSELRRGATGSWTFSGSRALLVGRRPAAGGQAKRSSATSTGCRRRTGACSSWPRCSARASISTTWSPCSPRPACPGSTARWSAPWASSGWPRRWSRRCSRPGCWSRSGAASCASPASCSARCSTTGSPAASAGPATGGRAEHLLRRFAGREDKALAAIFHHAAEGELAPATEQWGLELARRALAGSQAEEAAKVARKALEAEGEEAGEAAGRQRGELQRTLAEAERLLGNLDAAIEAAERAFTAFDRADEPAAAARAAHLLAEIAWQARRGDLARAWVERGLELARAAADEREAALAETLEKLLLLGATVTNLRGEHEEARRYFDELERRGRGKADRPALRGRRHPADRLHQPRSRARPGAGRQPRGARGGRPALRRVDRAGRRDAEPAARKRLPVRRRPPLRAAAARRPRLLRRHAARRGGGQAVARTGRPRPPRPACRRRSRCSTGSTISCAARRTRSAGST